MSDLGTSIPGAGARLSPPARRSQGLGPAARRHNAAGGERTWSGSWAAAEAAAAPGARLAAQPSGGGGHTSHTAEVLPAGGRPEGGAPGGAWGRGGGGGDARPTRREGLGRLPRRARGSLPGLRGPGGSGPQWKIEGHLWGPSPLTLLLYVGAEGTPTVAGPHGLGFWAAVRSRSCSLEAGEGLDGGVCFHEWPCR